MLAVRSVPSTRSKSVARVLVVVSLIAAMTLIALHQALQEAEASLARLLIQLLTSSNAHVPPNSDVVFFSLGNDQTTGIRVAPENSSALLAVPLLLASAALAWLKPSNVRKVFTSLMSAVAFLMAQNQLRVLLLVVLANCSDPHYDYYLGATVFGTTASALCTSAAISLFIWLIVRNRRSNTDPQAGEYA
jgi:hypothetical protein